VDGAHTAVRFCAGAHAPTENMEALIAARGGTSGPRGRALRAPKGAPGKKRRRKDTFRLRKGRNAKDFTKST
jgi:hypothetical protein